MQLILKIVGWANAFYLLMLHSTVSPYCMGGQSCSVVLSSSFSSVGDIPLAAVGLAVYTVLLLLDVLVAKKDLSPQNATALAMWITTPAAAVGLVLVGVQAIILQSFCPFCMLNSVLLVGLFWLTFKQFRGWSVQISLSQWLLIIVVFIFPFSFFIGSLGTNSHSIGTVAGDEITMDELKASDFNNEYKELNRNLYFLKRRFLNHKALEIESKKKGQSPEVYLKKLGAQTITITDEETLEFYNQNKHRIPSETPYSQVKSSIQAYLKQQKESEVFNQHLETLAKKYNVQMNEPSPDPVIVRKNKYAQFSIGNPDAPIHVIEFADLQCSHCKTAYIEFKNILNEFGDKIYFEYRHYPLPNNPFSKVFAKASNCSGEQNKFFDYIELTYANQSKLSKIQPIELANRLNLNAALFDTCMKSDNARRALEADIAEANRIGITSTPTFIVNGQVFRSMPSARDLYLFL